MALAAALCGVLCGALALLLAGCAAAPGVPAAAPAADGLGALPHYLAPTPGQPSARLLLRGSVQPGDRFAVLRHQDAVACQGAEVASEGGAQLPAPAVNIAAGALTTLEFVIARAGAPMTRCMNLSFTPVAGRSYLMQGMLVGDGCNVTLLDASRPDRPAPLPDALLRTAAGQRCMPLAQAAAMARARQANASPSGLGGQVDGEAVLNPRATAQDLQGLIRP